MMRTLIRSRLIARIALAAILFSTVSPALAATLLADRPAALARLLGIPAKPQSQPLADQASHAHHTHHGSDSKSGSGDPHSDHGVFCSFCLNATSTLALTDSPVADSALPAATQDRPFERAESFRQIAEPVYRSRAPPLV
jgi:hypothetical protein